VDSRIRTGGGDWRWLRIRGTVVRDRIGKTVRISGSMIDISRRKAAKAQVEDERFLPKQLIDQLERETWHEGTETRVITSKFPWRARHGVIKVTFGVSSDVTKLITAQRETTLLAQQLREKNLTYEEELHLAREIQQALVGEGFPVASASNPSEINFGARCISISDLLDGILSSVLAFSESQDFDDDVFLLGVEISWGSV
jgi:serine phosphatase RsbU (regulator of sigma subunit)